MRGLDQADPRIHRFRKYHSWKKPLPRRMGCRIKPGNDALLLIPTPLLI
jgi:hypothetical protein